MNFSSMLILLFGFALMMFSWVQCWKIGDREYQYSKDNCGINRWKRYLPCLSLPILAMCLWERVIYSGGAENKMGWVVRLIFLDWGQSSIAAKVPPLMISCMIGSVLLLSLAACGLIVSLPKENPIAGIPEEKPSDELRKEIRPAGLSGDNLFAEIWKGASGAGILGSKLSALIVSVIVVIYLAGDHLLQGKYAERKLSVADGIVLILLYLAYLGSQLMARDQQGDGKHLRPDRKHLQQDGTHLRQKGIKSRFNKDFADSKGKLYTAFVFLAFFILLILSEKVFLEKLLSLSGELHLDLRILGMLLLAACFNLPWWIRLMKLKDEEDIFIYLDQVTETQIFLLLFVLGLSSVIAPQFIPTQIFTDLVVLAVVCLAEWGLVVWRRRAK